MDLARPQVEIDLGQRLHARKALRDAAQRENGLAGRRRNLWLRHLRGWLGERAHDAPCCYCASTE